MPVIRRDFGHPSFLYLLQNQKAEQNSSTSQIRVGVLQLHVLIAVPQLPLHTGIAALALFVLFHCAFAAILILRFFHKGFSRRLYTAKASRSLVLQERGATSRAWPPMHSVSSGPPIPA